MAIEYVEHTADLGLWATGETLEEAFCEAARGLFMLMLAVHTVRPRVEYTVHIEAASLADLLVEWLGDLLAQKELIGLVFSQFDVQIGPAEGGYVLDGVALGEKLDRITHRAGIEVKGISYLGLDVRRHNNGWAAQCVVDV